MDVDDDVQYVRSPSRQQVLLMTFGKYNFVGLDL